MDVSILVNGEARDVPAGCTVAELVALFDLRPEQVAVELNRDLVTRDQRDSATLASGDQVELVTLVGGG